jgi:hypothetical protein
MIIKEEDAKKKICPVLRKKSVGFFKKSAAQEVVLKSTGLYERCRGSECMMWRWGPGNEGGYCGLAGKAEIG